MSSQEFIVESSTQKKIPDSALLEFVSECEELCARVSENFALIEKGEFSHEVVDSVYRDMHTIKGSSQLFGFKEIGLAAHAMEACLEPVRRLKMRISAAQMESLYKCLDLIERMVKALQSGNNASFKTDLEATIPRLIEASLASFGTEKPVQKEAAPWSVSLDKPLIETKTAVASQVEKENTEKTISNQTRFQTEGVTVSLENLTSPTAEKSESVSVPAAEQTTPAPNAEAKSGDAGTIRVPVALLDKLMVLMGEMVLVRNQVLQYSNQSDDLNFLNLSQRLDLVTSELQNEVMKTRMQPIGNVLSKFQRVVRDLSRDLNKKMELTL